ncbi:MAG: Rpp14/Pop5 family protein [Candidatus Woesearchaeota archaeon]
MVPKPTLKQKRRYCLVAFDREDLPYDTMRNIILENYNELYGLIGLAKARLLFLKTSTNNKIICRVNLESIDNLRATILHISYHKRIRVSSRIMGVSGTLKGLRTKFFKEPSAP